jgi:hypothetical protein
MTDQETLVKLLNKIGNEVENEIMEYDLTDEELQLVETAIVSMKQRVFEKLKNKV